MNGFPCRCGHHKNQHVGLDYPIDEDSWCHQCGLESRNNLAIMDGTNYVWPACENYVPDNLRYLEELSK